MNIHTNMTSYILQGAIIFNREQKYRFKFKEEQVMNVLRDNYKLYRKHRLINIIYLSTIIHNEFIIIKRDR